MSSFRALRRSVAVVVAVPVAVALLTAGCAEDAPDDSAGTPAARSTATGTVGSPSSSTSPTSRPPRTRPSATGSDAPQTPLRPEPGAGCLRARDHARLVRFGPGHGLGGYLMGTGRRYVVLAHQSLGESCQMLPLARLLAAAGFRALAFDSAGTESSAPGPLEGHQVSDDVLAAVAWSRGQQATAVALIGASKGGYGVLDAALQAEPPVDAVVSLSAPNAWDDPRGRLLDVSAMSTPTQLWAARQDSGFVEAARGFARQDTAAQLYVVPGAGHGVELVPTAFGRIRGFLDAHLR